MRLTSTRAVAVLLLSSALCGTSVAQEGDPEYATDYIIVKVLPGVEPQPLEGGLMSFRYVGETDLPPEEVAIAELLMAVFIQQWAVTSIQPMIRFPMQNAALASQTGLDRCAVPDHYS